MKRRILLSIITLMSFSSLLVGCTKKDVESAPINNTDTKYESNVSNVEDEETKKSVTKEDNKEEHRELSKEHLIEWDKQFVRSKDFDSRYSDSFFYVNDTLVHIPTTVNQLSLLFDLGITDDSDFYQDGGKDWCQIIVERFENGSYKSIHIGFENEINAKNYKVKEIGDNNIETLVINEGVHDTYTYLSLYDINVPNIHNGYTITNEGLLGLNSNEIEINKYDTANIDSDNIEIGENGNININYTYEQEFNKVIDEYNALLDGNSSLYSDDYDKIMDTICNCECTYNLIDLDCDNLPELILDNNGYWLSIVKYTHNDGLKLILDRGSYGTWGGTYNYTIDAPYIYYKNHDESGEYYSEWFIIENGELKSSEEPKEYRYGLPLMGRYKYYAEKNDDYSEEYNEEDDIFYDYIDDFAQIELEQPVSQEQSQPAQPAPEQKPAPQPTEQNTTPSEQPVQPAPMPGGTLGDVPMGTGTGLGGSSEGDFTFAE